MGGSTSLPLLPVNGQCIRYKSRYSACRSLIVCWQASLTRPWSGLFSLLVIHTSFLDILPSLKMLPNASPTIFSFPYAAAQSICLGACSQLHIPERYRFQTTERCFASTYTADIQGEASQVRSDAVTATAGQYQKRATCSRPSMPFPLPSRPGLPRLSMFPGLPMGF